MNICFIALGSNLKSPERQIRLAVTQLRKLPHSSVLAVAPLFRNKAVGRRAQPNYCNTVVKVTTTLSPLQLLKLCQQIETSQTRVRHVHWGARTIDLDILFYGNRVINSPTLLIPHPRIQEREFVLKPLLQLAPKMGVYLNEPHPS
jgi:2-amino-4-hydroxy-6-hydroxymethyldihydropteridine diphosphokinase